MATLAPPTSARRRIQDHRFYFMLAVAMTVTVVAGFATQLATGRSSFDRPIIYHLHAFVFFGWTFLYLMQNWLIASGSVAPHRRLGWLGAGWSAAVVVLGVVMTVRLVRLGHVPFFFTPSYFLFMNGVMMVCFAVLIGCAIGMRRRTAWHNRLMSCAMAGLTGAAFGRLLPLPLLIPFSGWYIFAAVMLFPLAGIVADLRTRGRIHPAWWCGVAALAGQQVAAETLAVSPAGLAIYHAAVTGSPGDHVAPLAYPPPP